MTEPNVVYDFEQSKIHVDVVVEEDSAGQPHVVAALPVLRPGSWTVIWTLRGFDNLSPIFDLNEGIQITAKPAELTHGVGERVPDEHTKFRMAFVNTCASANAASYLINFHFPPIADTANLPYHHDPSISVVSDPPAG